MLSRLKRRAGSERGFTLIELLVVILIIGILIAIAIPAYLGVRNRGYDARAQSNLRNAANGAVSYYEDNNESYTGMTNALLDTNYVGGGIVFGTGQDQVNVASASGNSATLTCLSGSGRTYTATLNRTQITITHD